MTRAIATISPRSVTGLVIAMIAMALLACQPLLAQENGAIKGRVFDRETGDPLPYANVIVVGTSIGTVTDLDGRFTMNVVPAGALTLRAAYVGYASVTRDVTVPAGDVLQIEFRLAPQAITGETVVVTAQAQGQNAAINQQLASNTIANVVSAARIKELPDVNAAESIGRLPGVSIDRYGGEATAVAIRGLAPKYNTVTVNGVALPATNNDDRSVDLSLVSSNILDGIELKKANTPDMDADALGGTVDLRLKEAPVGFQGNIMVQGGYNQLQKYTGNYSVVLGASNRFFDEKLGIIASLNADKNNRSADLLNAAYRQAADVQTLSSIVVDNFTLKANDVFKSRVGGSILGDYVIPDGKITVNTFYSRATNDGTYRTDQMDFTHNSHYYGLEKNVSKTSIYLGDLGWKQDFGWLKYDVGGALTGSETADPTDYTYQFAQENGGATSTPTAVMPLIDAWKLENIDTSITGLSQIFQYGTSLFEKQKTLQFNVQIPYQLSEDLTGYFKFGAKAKWLDRLFDQEQYGCGNLQYGGSWTGPVSDLIKRASAMYPNDFNVVADSTLISGKHVWPISRFLDNFGRSNFLDGNYRMGMIYSLDLMQKLTNALRTLPSNDWQHYAIGSFGNDYDGVERYRAAYIMTELNIGPTLTLIGGVRYDEDYTLYHGQSFREVITNGNNQQPPGDVQHNTNVRSNNFLLPMVHIKYQPFDWLMVRLAGTETVTRPDYAQYAPITHINTYQSYAVAANGGLKDSRSRNLDLSVSVHEKYIGFLTVSPFYKKIDNLIVFASIPRMDTAVARVVPAELNIPRSWLNSAPQVDTYLNNPNPAQYRGIELDWQTHFWYLPSFLQGLIFNINWTYIKSDIDARQFKTYSVVTFVPPRSYISRLVLVDTSRAQRMPDQPSHIMNATLGYDYEGFSIRLSYLYQSDKLTSLGQTPLVDGFTTAYARWDLAVRQKILDNLQVYANFNNLNNRHDESVLGFQQVNPTALEYYGLTIDVGIRYNL